MNEQKRQQKHQLFGQLWSYYDLKGFETVEVFKDTNHDTRSLMKSPDGQLFLYDFHEKMGFPDDEIIEHFFLLESEEQGRKYADANMFLLKSELKQWIYIGSDYQIKQIG